MAGLLKKYYPALLFFFLLAVFSFQYDYQHIIFKRPQSIHKWRQADGASITLNYYQGNMNFFRPETHNLTSEHGTSGTCYPSELPILYYAVACLYKLFGYHEWIYRGLNTCIFFLGLFYLFRLLRYLLHDVFWSICLPLLLFTSPVLVYYANNYLVNITALAITFIGWYYFIRFLFEKESGWFYKAIFFFFLAGMFKISALISLVACAFVYLTYAGDFRKGGTNKKYNSLFLLSMTIAFAVNAGWVLYARHYNAIHDTTYFSTTTFPIWDLQPDEIKAVIDNIRNLWLDQYYHLSVMLFFVFCLCFVAWKFKQSNPYFVLAMLVAWIEALVYIFLQFWTFADHDYYTIDLYIVPVLILICFFDLFKKMKPAFFSSFFLKWSFVIFLGFNLFYAKGKTRERYEGSVNDYSANKDFYTVTPYLRELGITPQDTVIAIPDNSHASLYLMNQKGWTEYTDMRFNKGIPIPYNADSAGIQSSVRKGAKYLIVNGIEELYRKPYLKIFAKHLAGKYNRILIFNLKDPTRNFDLDERKVVRNYTCDAETISADKEFFLNDSIHFEFARARSDSFAHGGKFSCRLDKQNPYGMTIRIKDVKEGQSLVISAWRKTSSAPGSTIIAQAPDFYNNQCKVAETANGWEKLVKEFFVTPEMDGKELTIYLYNEDMRAAYFDDLRIVQYEAAFR